MTPRTVKRSALADGKSKLRLLSHQDKIAAFKSCTRSLSDRYSQQIAGGMTDAELAVALEQVIGILGYSSARAATPAVAYKGAGLKIWADWEWPDMKQPPIFAGQTTIALARQLYRIPDPDDAQMPLF